MKKKIIDTFGTHTQVKLDLFHAVKRVASAASKKHPYFYAFLTDFRLVFRAQGDAGPQKKQPTPHPDILLANMETFIGNGNVCQGKLIQSSPLQCKKSWINSKNTLRGAA